MNIKFDSVTAKKLLAEYAEKINVYVRENKVLKTQIEDLKTTLKINKDILHKYLSEGKKNENSLLVQLKEENLRLNKKNEEHFQEKTLLERKIYKIQQDFEDRMVADRELIEKLNEKLFVYENKIKDKFNTNEVLKKELNKLANNQNLKKVPHVFVVEPSKVNLDLNNELNYTREILAKISRLMNTEKTKSENMQNQIDNLKKELNKYRKNNKSFEINCLANDIKLDSLEEENFSSESEIEFATEVEDNETNLDSPSFKFPDKVLMSQSISSKFSGKSIPKLDFTKVNAKYNSSMMKVDIKDIQHKQNLKSTEFNSINKKISVNDDDRVIKENNKLKAELKIQEKNKERLKVKIEKYKKLYLELKGKYSILSNTLKLAQNKIDILESHVKKVISIPTTEDTVNKRNLNNTSMNANTSVRDEYFSQLEDDEITYTVKEMKEKKKFP